jgi:hypothetical protein
MPWDVLIGGILAIAGGAVVAWWNSRTARRERLAAGHDLLDREAVDAAALAEVAASWADPDALTMGTTRLEPLGDRERDEVAEAVHARMLEATAALTRVAVGHHAEDVRALARSAREGLNMATNRALRYRNDVRASTADPRQGQRAVEAHDEARDAVAALQDAIRLARANRRG